MLITKRNGKQEEFKPSKIKKAILNAFESQKQLITDDELNIIVSNITPNNVESIQNQIEVILMQMGYFDVAKAFILYREKHDYLRNFAKKKDQFLVNYKKSKNTADSTIDDNSNIAGKNLAILCHESHKKDNQYLNRYFVTKKLRELYPSFNDKKYIEDLEKHIIYKHDENSLPYPTQYCCAVPMDPFLNEGIKGLGGLSSAPKNLDSYCGMYINLIFALSAQVLGAVATPGVLVYFDYFARKEWGNDYYNHPNTTIKLKLKSGGEKKQEVSIDKQIEQYFQQIVYSINQPAAARGNQSAFVNFSYFDKPYFDSIYGNHILPDDTYPTWDSVNWLQKKFMTWFNKERLSCLLTFPVESVSLLYKDGEFKDKNMFDFVTSEYANGHSFFTYISDSVDSLSSCCRLKNKLQKEFMFTNGMISEATGSKSVITLNMSRITQDIFRYYMGGDINDKSKRLNYWEKSTSSKQVFEESLIAILDRVYRYHIAYNELLWDNLKAKLTPICDAGFVSLDKLYLTIGINGLNQAAEFIGIECNDNKHYQEFCQFIFSIIKEQNAKHRSKRLMFNTEMTPCESAAKKLYDWDKQDGYWVPEDTNLYASYIFKPNDKSISILERIRMHGKNYIGDYLDGGSAAHLNLDSHLSKKQYEYLLNYAAEQGCQYLTFNVPNSECQDCGFITKTPIDKCPRCGSNKIDLYDRIIGYLTKINNWSEGRQIEQKTRVYSILNKEDAEIC